MKKIFIRAAALVLSASMLLAGCESSVDISSVDGVSSEQSSVSETSSDGQSSEENSSAAETPAPTESSVPAESETETDKAKFDVQWNLSSTWMQGDDYCGGYEVTVTNNTGSAVEGWTVEFEVPEGFELTSQWNGIFSVDGGKVTVTNEEYNGTIDNGGNISFGFNYASPKEFEPGDVTVNGTMASEGTSGGDDNNSDNNSSNDNSSDNSSTPAATTTTAQTAPTATPDPDGSTPVSQHGQLSVKGTQLVDKNGKAYQLKGMSTHGIGWFPDFVNEQAFKTLRDDWNTNAIRLAMYTGASEGYSGSGKATYEALAKKGIDIAIKLDMYVIVDWHVLADQSPQVMKADALRFFDEISKTYGKYPNIIYEICNEPNGYATWEGDVKPYAEEVIPVIRKNDPDAVIIVGTPTWSQDIDKALNNPLKYDNVMYALHFYAATHTDWLRDRLKNCVSAGLPVFVTEFGCCDASGNGANDFNQTRKWLELLDDLGISYMNWNLANKNESSSAFKSSASANGNWSENDMSESGKWIRKWFRGEQ
ncbi:MAG: cellulase family glycosylhydrolase [Eubacterium sp.]|nr:cellulase family glycosylhydrolase [Eubacterium sp.]